MKRNTCRRSEEPLVLTSVKMYGDWFQCTSCGYLVRMRVLGDTAHCSQCGGTMRRK